MQPTVLPKMPALLISISRGQDGQDDGLMRWTNSWCRQFTAHCSRLISAEYPTIANYIQGNARWTTTLLESLADKQEPTSLQHDTFQQNICRVHTTNEVSSSASRPECLQLVRQVVYRLQDGQKRWWKKKTKKNVSSVSQNITHAFKNVKQINRLWVSTRDNQSLRPGYQLTGLNWNVI